MILHKFLGVVLSPTFPVQPDVAVAELVFDLVMQLTSSYMLFLTYRALTRTDDILFFGSICLNRFVAVLDTIMLLAVDNASSSFLVHFSFVRSLVRYLALCIAVGYMSQRRVLRASRLVLRTHEELLSYFILGIAILAVLIGGGTVVAYFVSSLIAVSASDSLLDARPNASASEVLRAQTLAVSDVPPEMFEVMMAVNFPVIHGLQILIDGFFYSTFLLILLM
ncbi:hypothetical protein BC828DRAFT_374321 [Blastocladiella britannica]|nr:hypothetical protein BC828DRAFT_374321 [Blastocladiella britannica]